jgi:hypothetical protein
MRIYEREAAAGGKVLPGEEFKQRRLADARFPEDVGVTQAVGLLDAESDGLLPEIRPPDIGDRICAIGHPHMMREDRMGRTAALPPKFLFPFSAAEPLGGSIAPTLQDARFRTPAFDHRLAVNVGKREPGALAFLHHGDGIKTKADLYPMLH